MHIHYDPIARDLQEQVCQILNSDSQVSAMAYFFAEQSLDIDYNVRKSLASQGLAAIVMTPTLTLLGHDGVTTSWQCDDLTLQIVENPIVNRARLKNLGLSTGTALDVAEVAAECLAGPQGGHFGEYSAKQVQTAEQNNLLVVKATFKTTCSRQLSGIISTDISGNTVEIPFATRDELNSLCADFFNLSTSFESFSTEEIKADISSLYSGQAALSSRFDNLSAIFQPKGDYAAASSLTAYAMKADVPTKTSQLANDSGYLTPAEVKPSGVRPGFATSAEIALTADFAYEAVLAHKVAWENVTGKPDLDALSANALAEANKHSDQNLAIAEQYASDIADGVRVWTGENFIYKASIDIPTEPKYQGYVSKAVSAETVASIEWDKVDGKPEIPSKTSQLVNDSGYITSAEVKPSEDYEGYALNAQNAVNALNANTAGYADKAGAAPWDGITGKPNLALKADVPTKTSQLENDSGYLNEASLSDYVTKDELPSLTGYVTQDYVDSKVEQEATARQTADQQLRASIDQKADISSVPTKTSDLVNDSGYLTAHQSLSNYYTKEETDEKIAENQDAYALFSRNDQQKIEGDRLVYKLSADQWVNIGELALKSDISSSMDSATEEYVDDKVMQEALARQEADQQLRASIGEKANISQIPTKTSQLTNDSGFIGTEQLSDYYTKQQTDEAISGALSSAGNSNYIQSEDGTQRIYGNGDVSTLSSAPGTYGPWTDKDGVENTLFHVEPYVFQAQEGWIWTDGQGEFGGFSTSREECESMTSFESLTTSKTWTRTYTPGHDILTKVGELAVKYGVDFNTLSAQQLEIGDAQQVTIDKDGMRTVHGARVGFGQNPEGGKQAVVLEGSNDGGILLSGSTFAQAIYIDEPYKYDQKTRVATLGDVSSQMSAYVTKTEIEPFTMIPGFAANAYRANMATMDGNGVEIATDYAKKTDLTAKQDVLPYNQYTGLYDISAFGAAQAAWVKWSGVEEKPTTLAGYGITDAATKTQLNELSGIVIAANTQLEEIA